MREEVLFGKAPESVIHEDGTLRFHNWVCVPVVDELKKKILNEGHNTSHFVHLEGDKLCKDLKQLWWSNMKQEVVDYVAKCLPCQWVKMEHQRPARLLQPLEIPENGTLCLWTLRLPFT